MRKSAIAGLLMVAMLAVLGSRPGESSGPRRRPATAAEATEERIESVGRSLASKVRDLAAGVPAGSYPPESVQAILEQWDSTPECSVPVGVLTTDAEAITRFISEKDVEVLEPVIAGFLVDGWGRPIEVYLEPIAFPARPRILLRSAGANGVFEGVVYESGEFAKADADDDIVWSYDRFCRRSAEPDPGDESDPSSPDAGRQARTLTDLRHLGVALLSWITDQWTDEMDDALAAREAAETQEPCAPGEPPAGAEGSSDEKSTKATVAFRMPPLDVRLDESEVEALLHPSNTFFYMQTVPARDGWDEPLEVYLRRDELYAESVVVIRSPGRDGVFDGDCYTVGSFDPEDADQDIVWADGFFMRWPAKSSSLMHGDAWPGGPDPDDPGATAPPPGEPSPTAGAEPRDDSPR